MKLLYSHTRRDFETKFLNKDFPEFSDLINFLRDRCAINKSSSDTPVNKVQVQATRGSVTENVFVTTQNAFREDSDMRRICRGSHKFSRCSEFINGR